MPQVRLCKARSFVVQELSHGAHFSLKTSSQIVAGTMLAWHDCGLRFALIDVVEETEGA